MKYVSHNELHHFEFHDTQIEQENYHSKAWYELCKQYDTEICFSIHGKDEKIQAHITCNDENEDHPTRSICACINGDILSGYGSSMEYALLKLTKQLPGHITLKSCLTCRHGNFCPIGDDDNEIFCVNDFEPKQKSDLYFITEDEDERKRRQKSLFDFCHDYKPMQQGYFTYNDYYYQFFGM